jgi:dTDP-4-dehydrorhamnose 3,5-epimerase
MDTGSMTLDIADLSLAGIKTIRPRKFVDDRGFFSETYNKKALAEAGVDLDFVQDNSSLSVRPGTVRGLHFQSHPFAQDKLVRVVRGRIFDVAVDIRRGSSTFGQWVSAEISAEAWNQIFVPIGFAHGFCTLEPDTEVIYKVTNFYSAAHDLGIRWNDPGLGIPWPVKDAEAHLSEKDRKYPFLRDAADLF